MNKKLNVGILGATGAVGQRFIQLLENHPWFIVAAVFASEKSAGKSYNDAVTWRQTTPIPSHVKELKVLPCSPDHAQGVDFVFSSIPTEMAKDVEAGFAAAGIPVISNASAFRMEEDVPLVIPEVNPEHTALIDRQKKQRGWKGFIITNPNCSTIGLVPPLKALDEAFGLEKVFVSTMQALSGAGYPGIPREDIEGNILPHIGGEEGKIETEPKKLLGKFENDSISFSNCAIAAHTHRVDVIDGHLEAVSLGFTKKPTIKEVTEVLERFEGVPQQSDLPTAPSPFIHVFADSDRPQPRIDRDLGKGMAISVGKIRSCPILDIKMLILSHNTIRGAAGAAILNAELLVHQKYL